MHPFDWISRLFSSHNNEMEREEKMADEIIKENEEMLERAYEDEIPAAVIRYIPSQDDNSGPQIDVLLDEFHSPILPENGSIIWIQYEKMLRPFKCIRYDYIENGFELDTIRVYIVVEPATTSDVIPNPKFNI